MKVFLSFSKDGKLLIQSRIESDNSIDEILYYISPGESFMNVPYEQLAQSSPGSVEIPDSPDSSQIDPDLEQLKAILEPK